jgi:hypothetical protein
MRESPQRYDVTVVTALSGGKQKPLTLQQAAGIVGVSPDTIARWCKRYGIGKQLHRKAPWRVDPAGLAIVAAGDAEALAKHHAQRG